MAVPSTGTLSMVGIFSEKNEDDYSAFNEDGESNISLLGLSRDGTDDSSGGDLTINTAGGQGGDGVAPYAMSEFYGYDHDLSISYAAFILDDWNEGTINAGNDVNMDTRATFNTTDFEDGDLYVDHGTNQTTNTQTDRPLLTTYGTPSIVSDEMRFTNTDETYGMFCKTTDQNNPGINNVPTTQCVAWRFRFFMNTTNNKDSNLHINMNTTSHTNPAVTTNNYQFRIRDNSDPATGRIDLYKRTSTTSNTLLASSTSGAYTLGTTQDFILSWHRAGTGRAATYTWKIGMAPTTTPSANIIKHNNELTVNDGTYYIARGISMRAAKAMSVPTSTHYHSYDMLSCVQMDDPS